MAVTIPQDRPTDQPAAPAEPAPVRQLRRSKRDRVLGGVCGGLGRYLGVDPVVLRIVMVALVFTGAGVPLYIVAWIVIPEATGAEPEPPAPSDRHAATIVVGAALIALGALLMLRSFVSWFDSGFFWPLVVVAGGIFLVMTARR